MQIHQALGILKYSNMVKIQSLMRVRSKEKDHSIKNPEAGNFRIFTN